MMMMMMMMIPILAAVGLDSDQHKHDEQGTNHYPPHHQYDPQQQMDVHEEQRERVRAMMSLVAGSVPYVVLAVISAVVFSHVFEVPARLLAGLDSYLLPTSQDILSAAGDSHSSSTASAASTSGPRRRGGGRQQQQHGLERMHSRGLRMIELNKAAVPVLSYYRELDQALTLTFVSLVMLISGWALPKFIGLRGNAIVDLVSLACASYGAYAIFSTTWGSGGGGGSGSSAAGRGIGCSVQTSETERVISGCFGVLAGLASLVFLSVLDQTVVDFDVRGVLRDTQESASRYLSRPVDFGDITGRTYFVAFLVFVTAVLGSSLFSAAVRTSRCFALAVMAPPEWGASRLRAGVGASALMKLDVLLPACTVLLWIRPLVDSPGSLLSVVEMSLGVPQASLLPALRIVMLTLTGLTSLCAARHYVRSFMSGVIVAWYETLYATSSYSEDDVKRIEKVMGMKVLTSNALMGKVALQSAAPSVIMLGTACILTAKVRRWPSTERGVPDHFLHTSLRSIRVSRRKNLPHSRRGSTMRTHPPDMRRPLLVFFAFAFVNTWTRYTRRSFPSSIPRLPRRLTPSSPTASGC